MHLFVAQTSHLILPPIFTLNKRTYKKCLKLMSKVVDTCLTAAFKARSIDRTKQKIREQVKGYYCQSNQKNHGTHRIAT